eukprot:3833337-Prymnesium_polylepis.2
MGKYETVGARTYVEGGCTVAQTNGKSPKYRADVDGLRAVAIVAVILYHLNRAWLPGGFTGVDVFFVISGFVVSGSLLHTQSTSLCGFLVAFYARRVKRLTPALTLCVLVTAVCTAAMIDPRVPQLDDYLRCGQLALLGWTNNHFAARGTGYSDEGPEMLDYHPFTHT